MYYLLLNLEFGVTVYWNYFFPDEESATRTAKLIPAGFKVVNVEDSPIQEDWIPVPITRRHSMKTEEIIKRMNAGVKAGDQVLIKQGNIRGTIIAQLADGTFLVSTAPGVPQTILKVGDFKSVKSGTVTKTG